MLIQRQLIERTRAAAARDERLSAVLMYGSFARGGGDRFSDVEFWLFSDEELDAAEWIAQVGETYAVVDHVAIFKPSLVRGEFHFARSPAAMRDWTYLAVSRENLEDHIVLDRRGELRRELERLVGVMPEGEPRGAFLRWFLHGLDLLERGDLEKAQEVLGIATSALAPERTRLVAAYQEAWARALKIGPELPKDLRTAVTHRTQGL